MAHQHASGGSNGLRIHVLGPLEVAVDGAPIVVDTRKALAILALLAVERRPYAREELVALLWPDADDTSGRGALRRTLSVLRAALDDRWLRVDRSTVALDDDVSVDLRTIEAAATATDLPVLRTAADAARGPFLAGFSLRDSPEFDDWRVTRSTGVERTVAGVLDRLVTAAELAGDVPAAIAAAGRRVDLDPLDEAAHRRLMALLARTGDPAAAIRQYRACVATLERELGVPPLAETTTLYEAIRDGRVLPDIDAAAATAADEAAPAAVQLPLVGRDRELAAIQAARDAAVPDGQLVLLTGEAGIGKTRLVDAVIAAKSSATDGGGATLIGRCYAAEAGIAYGPIVELLHAGLLRPDALDRLGRLPVRTLAELDRLIALPGVEAAGRTTPRDDPAGRTRLVEAIADGLTALVADGSGRGAGVVAIEDLQWADDASRAALAWLGRRLAGRSLLLVLSWRPEDLDEAGMAFADAMRALPVARHVALDRLDARAVSALVEAAMAAGHVPLDPSALLDQSEGLPLFVVEALREAGGEGGGGPEGSSRDVRVLLRERLASVSDTGGQVLAAAAVLGRSFDAGLVRATSGRTEDETVDALEELVRRGLVREVPGRGESPYDFGHARFRDAAYEGLSLARRRLLHRRAADALRAQPRGRDEASRLVQVAGHERAAGRDVEAAEAFREAGYAVRAIHALHEAESHLETALALGDPHVVEIQIALGEIRTSQGDYASAAVALEAAAAIAGEPELPAIELRLGRVHARRGDPVTAASHLDAAIAALAAPDLPSREERAVARTELARALVERGLVAIGTGDLALAETCADRALAIADETGDPAAAGAASRVRGLAARARGDLEGARAALVRSLELAQADPDPGAAIAAGNALALVEAESGDGDAAIRRLQAALELSRRTGELHLEAAIENNLADQLHAAGRSDEAMEHLKRAVALFADVGGRPGELQPEIWKLVTW